MHHRPGVEVEVRDEHAHEGQIGHAPVADVDLDIGTLPAPGDRDVQPRRDERTGTGGDPLHLAGRVAHRGRPRRLARRVHDEQLVPQDQADLHDEQQHDHHHR